jgi:YD repeat-containing protein
MTEMGTARVYKPEGNAWTFGLTANRLTSVTDPLTNLTQYGYDLNDNRERVERCELPRHRLRV